MEEERKRTEDQQGIQETEPGGMREPAEEMLKEEVERDAEGQVQIRKEKKQWRGSFSWKFFITMLFVVGMLLFSSGMYTAWTTYHNSDLIEPFVCSYRESDIHAREVSEAFKNIVSRAEAFNGRGAGSFFSGNVNYGYCIKKDTLYGGKVYSNLSGNSGNIYDANIYSLIGGHGEQSGESPVYYDCYWWDVQSDAEVIYKAYTESRVKVPQELLDAKTISKMGICYSEGVLDEKEKNWQEYVQFMYLMTALLLVGGILVLYSGAKLFSYGKLPQSLRHGFLEIPVVMIGGSMIALYSCYERKVSLFSAQNHMEMLGTSAGSVQLLVDIVAGAVVLAICFMVFFLGLFILTARLREHDSERLFMFGILWKDLSRVLKKNMWVEKSSKNITHSLKNVFKNIMYPLKIAFKKCLQAWKFFLGLFTGKSIRGNTIAGRERKRILIMAVGMTVCVFGILGSMQKIWRWVKHTQLESLIEVPETFFCVFFLLLLLFVVSYLIGSIKNAVEYAKLEQMIEEVYQGSYQGVSAKKSGIFRHSLCFPAAERLERIGNGFQKAVEDQIHAERLKIELLTNVSHDLKTPLTSIISYVELLDREEGLPAEARDYVMILKKKAERLKTIISEVFELAKTTSGEIQIEKKEIDFYRLVVQTLGDMQDRIDASGLLIREKLEQKNVMIYSDGERLYRVLQNLLDNALKYSLKGTRIYLELTSKEGILTFTIKNIAGYEMEFEAGDITERFMRGDKNRTTEGSGLGLSIAQGFTIACGGKFAVMIDGDMFKVVIRFPVIKAEPKKELPNENGDIHRE